jgi:hypothetical protein
MARRIELRRAFSLLPPMNYERTGEPHELIQIAILMRIRGVALGDHSLPNGELPIATTMTSVLARCQTPLVSLLCSARSAS